MQKKHLKCDPKGFKRESKWTESKIKTNKQTNKTTQNQLLRI